MTFVHLRTVATPALVAGFVVSGCSSHQGAAQPQAERLPVRFVTAPAHLISQCRQVAHAVGYSAPCPMLIPRGLKRTQVHVGSTCHFQIVGLPCHPGRRWNGWRGWLFGSSEVADRPAHLVISASPTPLSNYAKLVNGPAWRHGERVVIGAPATINRWRGRWIFVSPLTNEGSAFAGHVVFAWTTHGHTYAVGFHDLSTRVKTRALDVELVRHIRLVNP